MMQLRVPIALCAVIVAVAGSGAAAKDQSKTETYIDGKPHFVYSVDSEGRKNGEFRELDPDGHLLLSATYAKDDLNGVYRSFFPGGKPKVVAAYAGGKLSGQYREFAESGEAALVATYKAGELNGPRQQILLGKFVKNEIWKQGKLASVTGRKAGKLHGWRREFVQGHVTVDEFWFNGQLLIPKGPQFITQELAAIEKMPVRTSGEFPNVPEKLDRRLHDPELQSQNEGALRKLIAYRFICDLPYKDMELDRDYMAHAQAGAEILTRVGQLTHTPENPGMPETEFQFAYRGTTHSNLAGLGNASGSVELYMDDSDASNIDRVGHRRWCLNPAMLRTGFGVDGSYSAMWSFNMSRRNVPDYDAVAFPPRGLTPSSHFKSNYAWSLSLNPLKFHDPDSSVKVTVTPMRFDPEKVMLERETKPLEMDYFKVTETSFGGSMCIIFRPKNVSVSAWSAYSVSISGLKNLKGQDVPVEYFVGFFDPVK
jgi:hypothetical protein